MMNDRIEVGQSVSVEREINDEDIAAFADLSLDRNPVHFDDQFAARTIFGRRIAHGMLGAALISGALTKLMGEGNIWLSVSLQFQKPIYPGDRLSATLSVTDVSRRGVATIDVSITNAKHENVVTGTVQSMRFVGSC